tara:strand:- start:2169 stop:2429 length:261 start_codon:yes stop_codon:yes gene_type:complete
LYVFAAKIFDGLTPIDEVEREFTARIEETFLSKQKEQIPTTTYPDKVPKTQQRRRHHTLRPNLPLSPCTFEALCAKTVEKVGVVNG